MSNSAVLTNEDLPRKRGLSTDLNKPKFAILNPELTLTLPPYQVACGGGGHHDAHPGPLLQPLDNPLTDALAEGLPAPSSPRAAGPLTQGPDYSAMSELMWAGSLSHNGLTGLGGQGGTGRSTSWAMSSPPGLTWPTGPPWPPSGAAGPSM